MTELVFMSTADQAAWLAEIPKRKAGDDVPPPSHVMMDAQVVVPMPAHGDRIWLKKNHWYRVTADGVEEVEGYLTS